MIRSFTVKNFKSIQNEVALHFDAYKEDRVHWGNVSETSEGPILTVMGLWGPNASGKSNVLEALKGLRQLVCTSQRNELDEPIRVFQPYKLNEKAEDSKVSFSLEFFERQTHGLYSYSVVFNRKKVFLERLLRLRGEQEEEVYTRDQNGQLVMGDKARGELRVPVLDNQLVLSVAAQQPEGPELLKNIFRFFKNDIRCLTAGQRGAFVAEDAWEKNGDLIGRMLSLADFGIQGIDVQKTGIVREGIPDSFPEGLKEKILKISENKVLFLHNGVPFQTEEESEGTVRFFEFIPLLIDIFSDWDTADTLVVDEIECKLHPLVVKMMIWMFQDPELNVNHHQLIFTTHNTSFLDSELFRRDQIWFTQKRKEGNTELTCLAEYEGVEADTNFEQWYRMGRFEALPEIAFKEIKAALIKTRKLREKEEK